MSLRGGHPYGLFQQCDQGFGLGSAYPKLDNQFLVARHDIDPSYGKERIA